MSFFVNTQVSKHSKSQRCYIRIFLAAECTSLFNFKADYYSQSQSLTVFSLCSLSLHFDLSWLVILFLYNVVVLYITVAQRDNPARLHH